MEREKIPMPVFDAIVANPPYIAQELIDKVKPGTKQKIAAVCENDHKLFSIGNGMVHAPALSAAQIFMPVFLFMVPPC